MDCGNEIMAREVLPGAVGDVCDFFFFFLTHWFSKGWMWLGQWLRGRRGARDSNRRCDAADTFPPSADVQDWSDSLLLPFTPCLRWSSAPVFRYEPAAGWSKATLESFDSGTIKFEMCPRIPATSGWMDNFRSQEGRESLFLERWSL